eukprot:15264573-Alexandrium_andersonii.AAC.1
MQQLEARGSNACSQSTCSGAAEGGRESPLRRGSPDSLRGRPAASMWPRATTYLEVLPLSRCP